MISATARLPQKRKLSSPASIAPGIASMIALSTISMIVIEIVSEANAIGATAASVMPDRSRGIEVSE